MVLVMSFNMYLYILSDHKGQLNYTLMYELQKGAKNYNN